MNADYLKDGFGDFIFPDDWMIKCAKAPHATYYIVEKAGVELVDPEEDIRYDLNSLYKSQLY